MSSKTLYYLAAFIGSTLGGLVPLLWGASLFSYSGLIFSSLGGIIGIIVVYKLA